MKSFIEKLETLKREIRFTKDQKEAVRARLLHSLEIGESLRATELSRQHIQRSTANGLFPNLKLQPMPIAIIALIAILGGGTSFAAEKSLPGDLLYPIKVNVNEEVRGAFAFSPNAKAELETELIRRRLEEAAKLTTAGRINESVQAELEVRFKDHAGRAAEAIKALRERHDDEDADTLSTNLEVALRAHGKALGAATTTAAVEPLKSAIRIKLDEIIKEREDHEDETASSTPATEGAARGKIEAAANVIASVKSFIELKTAAGTEARSEAEADLAKANARLDEAKVKLNAKAYGDAFRLAKEAARKAQEVREEIDLKTDLHLEGRGTTTVRSEGRERNEDENRIEVENETEVEGHRGRGELKIDFGF